jgi:hypothetical protein
VKIGEIENSATNGVRQLTGRRHGTTWVVSMPSAPKALHFYNGFDFSVVHNHGNDLGYHLGICGVRTNRDGFPHSRSGERTCIV